MNGKIEFREKLKGILTLAEDNGFQITVEETERYFEEENLSKEQMELVFDYLLSQKVVVKGYTKTGGAVLAKEQELERLTVEEEAYLKSYLKNLETVREEEEGERISLFQSAVAGDALAKSRLTELYLKEVVTLARQMHCQEVFLGDLIQEGNVGLLLGLEQIQNTEEAHEMILEEIRKSIQTAIEEQTEVRSRDKKMVEKVHELDESIKTLTEDLGRKVTLEELAVYMGMSEEEVEDILRLAGEDTEKEEE